MRTIDHATLAFAATLLLVSCNPDAPSGDGKNSGELTPALVERKLDDFNHDVERVLAVVEPLEGDGEEQFKTLFESDDLSGLIKGHVEKIQSLTSAVNSMSEEERSKFAGLISSELELLDRRVADIYASGAAAEDAFAPLFVAVQEALRTAL